MSEISLEAFKNGQSEQLEFDNGLQTEEKETLEKIKDKGTEAIDFQGIEKNNFLDVLKQEKQNGDLNASEKDLIDNIIKKFEGNENINGSKDIESFLKNSGIEIANGKVNISDLENNKEWRDFLTTLFDTLSFFDIFSSKNESIDIDYLNSLYDLHNNNQLSLYYDFFKGAYMSTSTKNQDKNFLQDTDLLKDMADNFDKYKKYLGVEYYYWGHSGDGEKRFNISLLDSLDLNDLRSIRDGNTENLENKLLRGQFKSFFDGLKDEGFNHLDESSISDISKSIKNQLYYSYVSETINMKGLSNFQILTKYVNGFFEEDKRKEIIGEIFGNKLFDFGNMPDELAKELSLDIFDARLESKKQVDLYNDLYDSETQEDFYENIESINFDVRNIDQGFYMEGMEKIAKEKGFEFDKNYVEQILVSRENHLNRINYLEKLNNVESKKVANLFIKDLPDEGKEGELKSVLENNKSKFIEGLGNIFENSYDKLISSDNVSIYKITNTVLSKIKDSIENEDDTSDLSFLKESEVSKTFTNIFGNIINTEEKFDQFTAGLEVFSKIDNQKQIYEEKKNIYFGSEFKKEFEDGGAFSEYNSSLVDKFLTYRMNGEVNAFEKLTNDFTEKYKENLKEKLLDEREFSDDDPIIEKIENCTNIEEIKELLSNNGKSKLTNRVHVWGVTYKDLFEFKNSDFEKVAAEKGLIDHLNDISSEIDNSRPKNIQEALNKDNAHEEFQKAIGESDYFGGGGTYGKSSDNNVSNNSNGDNLGTGDGTKYNNGSTTNGQNFVPSDEDIGNFYNSGQNPWYNPNDVDKNTSPELDIEGKSIQEKNQILINEQMKQLGFGNGEIKLIGSIDNFNNLLGVNLHSKFNMTTIENILQVFSYKASNSIDKLLNNKNLNKSTETSLKEIQNDIKNSNGYGSGLESFFKILSNNSLYKESGFEFDDSGNFKLSNNFEKGDDIRAEIYFKGMEK